MKYKDILDTFGWDTSYADRAQAALLKWDTTAFSDVAKEYKASQQWQQQAQTNQMPAQSTSNTWWNNVWDWNYWADTIDRQDEIVSNLNAAYEQNPSQFSDWNTFAKNFNYDYSWRSDKERETMWNWYNNKTSWQQAPTQKPTQQIDGNNANNTDYFFNQLINWSPLQWEWAAISAAQNRYNNLKYLSSMTPDQITSAITSWNLSAVWQEMQDLKNYAPALYAQIQAQLQQMTQLDDINTLWDWIYNWLTWAESNKNYTNYDMTSNTSDYVNNASIIQQYNSDLYKKIQWLWWDTAAYVAIVASMLQNPNIQSSKNEVEELEWEIRNIQENIYTIWDTCRTMLWSEAPEDLVSAYISQQTKALQNQLRTAQNSLLVAQWKLNNQLTEVETMIDAIDNWIKLQQYNDNLTSSSWWTWSSSSSYTYSYYPQTVDTNNYQDDSDARLKEIANNLESLYKSNPELFKNRATFNNYFKYNQRSAKQKMVLDTYWSKYGNKFSIWTWESSSEWTSTENDKRRKLMWWIISGDVWWWYGKTAMAAYWFERELNEQEVMANIALICTPSEYNSLLKRLWTWAKAELNSAIDERIDDVIDANASKIQSRLKSVKKKDRADEAEKLAKELWINFWTKWWEHIINYYNSL